MSGCTEVHESMELGCPHNQCDDSTESFDLVLMFDSGD